MRVLTLGDGDAAGGGDVEGSTMEGSERIDEGGDDDGACRGDAEVRISLARD